MVVAVIGSRPAVGESYSTSGGSVTTARAIPTRRRIPPDNSAREFVEGVFELDEPQRFLHPAANLGLRRPCFHLLVFERIGDILRHGERIKQTALLKKHADPAAQWEQHALGEAGDLLTEQPDLTGVGFQEADSRLHQRRLAAAGGPQHHDCFPRPHLKRDIHQRGSIEAQRDVVESQHAGGPGISIGAHWLLKLTKIRVMMEVTTKIQTQATTTACVVARPTPCVPPVVRSP